MLTQTADASNTLFSDRYQQTYHSTYGARSESLHVFLHGSGVHDRLINKLPTRVLEIGFGLGLNCLLCADSASKNCTSLDYTGIEHAPIDACVLDNLAYDQWLDHPDLTGHLANILASLSPSSETALTAQRIDPSNGRLASDSTTEFATGALGEHANLTLHINDATSSNLLDSLQTESGFDAIFLDAFSPEVNPECWTESFFTQLHRLLNADGRLATYCVKGSVRRNLGAAGFAVNKYPGPTGKREVLWAGINPCPE